MTEFTRVSVCVRLENEASIQPGREESVMVSTRDDTATVGGIYNLTFTIVWVINGLIMYAMSLVPR